MKRTITLFLACAVVIVIIPACLKDASVPDDLAVKKQVTVKASVPSEGFSTRVALTQDETSKKLIKLSWENDDEISINGEPFTIDPSSISSDGKTAEFTGNDPGEGPYTIVYSDMPGSFAEQTQSADGNTDHLGYSASLSGVTDYEVFSFDSGWAAANGATLSQSSVLRLRALLPADVAASVQKVIFKASADVFDGGKTLILSLTTHGTAGEDNELDVYATLPAGDITLTEDMDLLIQFQVSDAGYDKYTAYRQVVSGTDFIVSGQSQYLGIKCTDIESFANASNAAVGESADNPYLIGDQHQMNAMHNELTAGSVRYFKLVDDIDLTGIAWIPLCNGKPYTRYVDFDGNGKTISHLTNDPTAAYPGLFGIFNGAAKNLTISDAAIVPTSDSNNKGGVFASYIGTSGIDVNPGVYDVVIRNSSVGSSDNRMGNYAGGLCGQVENDNTTIKNVTVTKTNVFGPWTSGGSGGVIGYVRSGGFFEKLTSDSAVSAYQYVGGVIGAVNVAAESATAFVSKCWFTGDVTAKYRHVGGLVGGNVGSKGTVSISDCYVTGNTHGSYGGGILGLHQSNATEATNLTNCYVTGSVQGTFGAGGIVGTSTKDGLSVIRCMPFNSEIRSTATDDAEHYSSGAVIAYAKGVNVVVSYCYRVSDMADRFSDCPGNSANVIEQHAFINSPAAIPQRKGLTYGYYHHGRNTNYSLCDLVHSGAIGEDWSSKIWDFSGELPTLK